MKFAANSNFLWIDGLLAFSAAFCVCLVSINIYDGVTTTGKEWADGEKEEDSIPTGNGGEASEESIQPLLDEFIPIETVTDTNGGRIELEPDEENTKPEDYITLNELRALTSSSIPKLKHNALQIILDRAMSAQHLPYIFLLAKSKELASRRKAFTVLHQLVFQERNKAILVKKRLLKILVRSLTLINTDEVTNRHIVACLYQLCLDNDKRKSKICGYGIVKILCRFLRENPGRYSDLKYWCIMLLYQFSLTESVTNYLLDEKVIYVLVDMAKLTYGNLSMQKTCLHSIVRILSTLEDEFATKTLKGLADKKLLSLATASLRSNDAELAQWTIFLIHEFAVRKVHTKEIVKIKGLLKIFLLFVAQTESIIPRIIFRTLKVLCDAEKSFHKEVIRANALPNVLKAIKDGEEQIRYWASSLLHSLMGKMRNHDEFFRLNGMVIISKLMEEPLIHLKLYWVDMISVLSTYPSNVHELEQNTLVMTKGLIKFLEGSELELRSATLSLLINLLSISGVITNSFLQENGLNILSKIVLSKTSSDELRPMAAKAVSCMTQVQPGINIEILIDVLIPSCHLLFEHLTNAIKKISLDFDPDSPQSPYKSFSSAIASSPSTLAATPQAPSRGTFPHLPPIIETPAQLCIRVAASLEAIDNLFTRSLVNAISLEDEGCLSYISELLEDIATAFLNALVFPLHDNTDTDEFKDCEKWKRGVAINGICCIQSVLRIELMRDFFVKENLGSLLDQLLFGHGDELPRHVICTYHDMIINSFPKDAWRKNHATFKILLKAVVHLRMDDMWAYFNEFSSELCDFTTFDIKPEYVLLSQEFSTPMAETFKHSLHAANRYWTFETIRATHSVTDFGKFAYEFHLGTASVIQVGWVCDNHEFNEFGGWGVGDYYSSFAFDGKRVCKWNGSMSSDDESYGLEWNVRDVVTCLIDLDGRTMSFLLNGTSMGVAFSGFDPSHNYYPAISMTGGQWGRFRFGSLLDKMQFCPPDHNPIPYNADDHMFYSTSDLLEGPDREDTSTNNIEDGQGTSNLSLQTPTTIDSIYIMEPMNFYYELQIGLLGLDPQYTLQLGCLSDEGCVLVAAFHWKSSKLFFLKIEAGCYQNENFDWKFTQLLNLISKNEVVADTQLEDLQILGSRNCELKEGNTIGVGVEEESSRIVFTLNGRPINGFEARGTSFIPYFRNIPRYLLNFGQFDFISAEANRSYSPS